MVSPITGKAMKLMKARTDLSFRKDKFSVMYHYYLCEDSGEKFTSDELDHINVTQVHNQYREKYGIPFPDEIKEVRLKYGLSAAKMSTILGFGPNTYRLYEAGEIPSVSNGRLILSIKQPEEFIRQIEASRPLLNEKEFTRYKKLATELQATEISNPWNILLEEKITQFKKPNEFSGYRQTDFNKINAIIAYLGKQIELYKTKLNKLLFYCDFSMYQKYGYSITGIQYRAIPYGPVPAEYDKIYLKLQDENKICIIEKDFKNGFYGEVILSNNVVNKDYFSSEELATMDNVIEKLGKMTTKEIVDLSHQEKAWQNNQKDKKLISYQAYAFDLKAVQ